MARRQAGAACGRWSVLRARGRRTGAALGLGAVLALPLVVAAPAPAQAAGLAGYCPDATGVTVVVDFQALGGGVVVRCAPAPLAGSGTGLDALVGAGITLEGTRRWGDSFICRLGGKPAVTTSLAVTGQSGYHEQCLDTPPSAAFWGYWYASDGGSWQYSQQGVKGHRAIAGGFEGWSFSLNASGSGNPTPRLAPTRPATPATSAPAATTGGGSASAAAGSGSGAAPSASGARSTIGPGSGAATTPGATSTPTAPAPGAVATSSGRSAATTAAGATAPPSDLPVVSGELAAAPVASSGAAGSAVSAGPSTGTVVGVGALAFLVVAGAGTAWRRRRGTDQS